MSTILYRTVIAHASTILRYLFYFQININYFMDLFKFKRFNEEVNYSLYKYFNQITFVLPSLRARGAPYVIFIVTSSFGENDDVLTYSVLYLV